MASPVPAAVQPSLPAMPPLQPCLIFLDIDGVLNRLEDDEEEPKKKKKTKSKKLKKEKKKGMADEVDEEQPDEVAVPSSTLSQHIAPVVASSSSLPSLPCIPSLEFIRSVIERLGLQESFDAELVRNLCRLVHEATCCGGPSSTADSPSLTDGFQFVLTTTWRLRPESLRQVRDLLVGVGLVKNEDAVTVATSPRASMSSCSLPLHPLLLTPDLKGWAARAEEIVAFIKERIGSAVTTANTNMDRTTSHNTVPQSIPCFLILDDMDLYAGVSLNCEHEEKRVLIESLKTRTLKLNGRKGLDESVMEEGMAKMKSLKVCSFEMEHVLKNYCGLAPER